MLLYNRAQVRRRRLVKPSGPLGSQEKRSSLPPNFRTSVALAGPVGDLIFDNYSAVGAIMMQMESSWPCSRIVRGESKEFRLGVYWFGRSLINLHPTKAMSTFRNYHYSTWFTSPKLLSTSKATTRRKMRMVLWRQRQVSPSMIHGPSWRSS